MNTRRRRGSLRARRSPALAGSRIRPAPERARSANTTPTAREPWRAHPHPRRRRFEKVDTRPDHVAGARSGPHTAPVVICQRPLAYRKLTALYCDSASVFLRLLDIRRWSRTTALSPPTPAERNAAAPHRMVVRAPGPGEVERSRKSPPDRPGRLQRRVGRTRLRKEKRFSARGRRSPRPRPDRVLPCHWGSMSTGEIPDFAFRHRGEQCPGGLGENGPLGRCGHGLRVRSWRRLLLRLLCPR